jgi:hypothetical protein
VGDLKPLAWAIGFAIGSLLAAGAFYSTKYLIESFARTA